MKKNNNYKIIIIGLILSIITSSCQAKLGKSTVLLAKALDENTTSLTNNNSQKIVDYIGQVEFRKIVSGDKCKINNYLVTIAKNEAELQDLLENKIGNKTNSIFLPDIDFEKRNVIGIFLGDRQTAGFSVEIEKIEESKDFFTIFLKEKQPQKGEIVKAEITQPFLIIETKKTIKNIVFENSSLEKVTLEELRFKNIESGSDSGIKEFSKKIAKTKEEFSDLYKEHLSKQKLITTPIFPYVDFNNEMIAAIFLGERPSSGYNIKVTKVTKTNSRITIFANEETPEDKAFTYSIVTSPYTFITIPKNNLPINFDINLVIPESGNFTNVNPSINTTKELEFKHFIDGDSSGIKIGQYLLIKDKKEFRNIWNEHSNSKDSVLPDIDFSKNSLISVFLGDSYSGYSIKFDKIIDYMDEVRIFVEIEKNKENKSFKTNPFSMILISKTYKNPIFIINKPIN